MLNLEELETAMRDLATMKRLITGGWCQIDGWQDAKGLAVTSDSPKGVRFSLTAALMRATDAPSPRFYRLIAQFKGPLAARGFKSPGNFNDDKSTTKEEVMRFIMEVALIISVQIEEAEERKRLKEENATRQE